MYNNAYTPVLVGKLTCRVVMLISTLDLPARAIVLNQKQFNGHSSCCWCEIEGGSPPNLAMVSYFPYPGIQPVQYTRHTILANTNDATKNKAPVSCVYAAALHFTCWLLCNSLCFR